MGAAGIYKAKRRLVEGTGSELAAVKSNDTTAVELTLCGEQDLLDLNPVW